MNISVEVSLYPLEERYKSKIKSFLHELNQLADGKDIELRTSNMSTRIFGPFDQVNEVLNKAMHSVMHKAMHNAMHEQDKMVFVCKYLNMDARELSSYD